MNKQQRIKKFYEDMDKDYNSLAKRIPEIFNQMVIKECNKLKKKYQLRAKKEFKVIW